MQPSATEARIVALIEREALSLGGPVGVDDDLLSGEFLDSVGVLRLTAAVETEFRFKIEPADYLVENFQTIAVLARFVEHNVDRRSTDR